MEKFIELFAEQFEETPIEVFKGDTVYKDLEEWSSLTALAIISMIDEEYDVVLRGDDIRDARTLEDLYKIVESRM